MPANIKSHRKNKNHHQKIKITARKIKINSRELKSPHHHQIRTGLLEGGKQSCFWRERWRGRGRERDLCFLVRGWRRGKRVASRKEDLVDIVEHFNIDVENPCVIMSQDKSREFLHSGNAKDKFKFFFKATLLHHVADLLKSIEKQLIGAQELVGNLESSISPILKELSELQGKIKSMEQVEEKFLKGHSSQIAILMERTSEVRKMQEELQQKRSENFHLLLLYLLLLILFFFFALGYKKRSELEEDCSQGSTNPLYHTDLRSHQTNKRHHHRFGKAAHRSDRGPPGDKWQKLVGGDKWAYAVENAVGRLLNAFIVNDHKDNLVLRACAREANYNHLQIIIYDFSRPRLNIPDHLLPQINHPTTISVLRSENATVMNVLIDVGHAERQVLVSDYSVGKSVAFDRNIQNLKEVYTLEGYKMFSRRSAQTTLPPNRNVRTGRLCSSFDDQIKNLENDASHIQEEVRQAREKRKRLEDGHHNLRDEFQLAKRRRTDVEGILRSKKFALQDTEKSYALESSSRPTSNVDELYQDKIKASELKASFENLCESAKAEIHAFEKEEQDMMQIEEDLHGAKAERNRFELAKNERVIPNIKEAELRKEDLENNRKVNYKKASIICLESEIQALGGNDGSTPEQLSAQLTRLNQRLQRESQNYPESIDDLRMMHDKKERKIFRKRQTYKMFRQKLHACQKSLELRYSKFQRNATLLKRQLTWQFNGHLRKKGISGQIKISYEDETLSIEVKMPQDASNNTVRDTRGLSGGERSFSTLCFALALHEMTEAPFRAMDEFDVFMDAVSRKISLDTLVDFALAQGSQWIFITPHDISMVKQDERIKKQQMAAPRS
ncbi:hypothetical protein DCAR_0414460 [Daucus carota subsp. sativus]|uniref:RecF/RecN/SMC N-terminal domain-containing protein n=1 Tax=Daucus carota subsp. sativus TaxID=79200 RepID=A0AAF0WSV3_DAUCS|nr:hypothetical protein DCAR_0414460 [Daucus carota subsp. sativus]